MNIGVVSVDSLIPNLALMKLSAWHKAQGDNVEIASPMFGIYDRVYQSKTFTYTPDYEYGFGPAEVILGGTGYSITESLPESVESTRPDYSIFGCDHGVGFTTRGCIRRCNFCVVPRKEGHIRIVNDLEGIIEKGQRWAMLLDNNLTAAPEHLELIMRQSRSLKCAVDVVQAFDARLITREIADVIHSGLHKSSIRVSFDDEASEESVMPGIMNLVSAGFPRSRIMVFCLIGAPWMDFEENVRRISNLRDKGFTPFAMPYKALDGTFNASDVPAIKQLARWANRQELKACSWHDYQIQLPRAAVALDTHPREVAR